MIADLHLIFFQLHDLGHISYKILYVNIRKCQVIGYYCVTLSNGAIVSTTFTPTTASSYNYIVTTESISASREMNSQINNGAGTAIQFSVADEGLNLQNQGTQTVTITTTIDQVGTNAQQTEVTSELPSGQTVTIKVAGGSVYLPIIVK